MTKEDFCKRCSRYAGCGFISRELQNKCDILQTFEEGYEQAIEKRKRMTQEELIKSWVAYRGEANVTNEQLQAIKWVLEKIDCGQQDKIDWEQRRYEIAKTMLPCITTLCCNAREDKGVDITECVDDAVRFADMLIEEIKSREIKQTTNKTINHYDN